MAIKESLNKWFPLIFMHSDALTDGDAVNTHALSKDLETALKVEATEAKAAPSQQIDVVTCEMAVQHPRYNLRRRSNKSAAAPMVLIKQEAPRGLIKQEEELSSRRPIEIKREEEPCQLMIKEEGDSYSCGGFWTWMSHRLKDA